MKLLFLFFGVLIVISSRAQDSANWRGFNWDIFLENYYSFDFNRPPDNQKPAFIYNHNRHNEFNINIGLARAKYESGNLRACLSLMAGTYAEENLANEPGQLKLIYEARTGLKLFKKKDLWVEAGILPSHIGFETVISNDCWTLTRSLQAENSPYYETGLKTSYTSDNQKWYLSIMVLNGWQRISRPKSNNSIAYGSQITYTPSEKLAINSSSFIGNDKPDSLRKWRYFHDLYSLFRISKNFGITIGFDCGFEQKEKNSSELNTWYSQVLILRYKINNWSIAARAEYFGDRNGVIIPLVNNKPFQMQGYSLNLDRKLGENAIVRIEGRMLKNSSPYFQRKSNLVAGDFWVTTSVAFQLKSNSLKK